MFRDSTFSKSSLSVSSPNDSGLRLSYILFHDLLCSPIFHHTVCGVTTDHNPTPVMCDDWNVSRLFITRTSHAEHTVDQSHEISTLFQHGPECIMPRYTRMIHALDRDETYTYYMLLSSSSSSWREDSWGPLRRLSMMTVILCLLPLPSDTQWWSIANLHDPRVTMI